MTLTVTNTANDASLLVGGIEALKFNSQGLITTPITVRQTVELGPVDTNGFASFGGSTGSTTVTASGTLYLNAANGMVNRRGSTTNPSWTGASTNGTMYAYLDIAADGSCTSGLSTLAPTYRWGGADVVTSGQFTFNIQEMTGKVGNGATAVQTYRVYVGEFTVAGNVVTAITWYALMGRYDSGLFAVASSTTYTRNHNLGYISRIKTNVLAADDASGTNERSMHNGVMSASAGQNIGNEFLTTTRNTVNLYTAANPMWSTTAGFGFVTTGYYRLYAERGW